MTIAQTSSMCETIYFSIYKPLAFIFQELIYRNRYVAAKHEAIPPQMYNRLNESFNESFLKNFCEDNCFKNDYVLVVNFAYDYHQINDLER